MVNHPYITSQLAMARRQDLQAGADHHRLVRATRDDQPRTNRRSDTQSRRVRRFAPTPRLA